MKRCILVTVISLLLALALPVVLGIGAPGRAGGETRPVFRSSPSPAPAASPAAAGADRDRTITLLRNGEIRTMTLAEYLPGTLAGEMPAAFEEEALRAQAVAARTFALFRAGQPSPAHPEAAVCDDPGCCQVWLDEEELRHRWGEDYEKNARRIRRAVEDTDGRVLLYEGEPILACFHSSSAGFTEAGGAVWGEGLPYLVSVSSPETEADVPGFVSTVEVPPEDFREAVLAEAPAAAITDTLPPDWLGSRTLDTSGRVASVRIGGAVLSGTALRRMFALRSAHFTVEWTGRSFLFTVLGYGHGAGMSQYGANVMAREGAAYAAILVHYYPGTELSAAPV